MRMKIQLYISKLVFERLLDGRLRRVRGNSMTARSMLSSTMATEPGSGTVVVMRGPEQRLEGVLEHGGRRRRP